MRGKVSPGSAGDEMGLAFTAAAASNAVAKSGENVRDAALAATVAIAAPRNSRRVGVMEVILLECASAKSLCCPRAFRLPPGGITSNRTDICHLRPSSFGRL